jgi:hypothetical protein
VRIPGEKTSLVGIRPQPSHAGALGRHPRRPLAVGLRARNRRIPLGTAPYADPIRRERPAPLRVDVGGAMTPRGSG